MVLGQRFDAALGHAARLHRTQLRKATDVPYVSHLLAVASLVIEDGGDEDEAIAALLHDAVEDQGGVAVLDDIRARFGPRVADIVEACSDSLAEDPAAKAPWRARKEQYLAHMAEAPAAVLRVACADKLHNARCMLAEYRTMGEALWDRFNGGRAGTPVVLPGRCHRLRPAAGRAARGRAGPGGGGAGPAGRRARSRLEGGANPAHERIILEIGSAHEAGDGVLEMAERAADGKTPEVRHWIGPKRRAPRGCRT